MINSERDSEYRHRIVKIGELHVLDCGNLGSKQKMSKQHFLWFYTAFPELPLNSVMISSDVYYNKKISSVADQGFYFCYGFHNVHRKFYWMQQELILQSKLFP